MSHDYDTRCNSPPYVKLLVCPSSTSCATNWCDEPVESSAVRWSHRNQIILCSCWGSKIQETVVTQFDRIATALIPCRMHPREPWGGPPTVGSEHYVGSVVIVVASSTWRHWQRSVPFSLCVCVCGHVIDTSLTVTTRKHHKVNHTGNLPPHHHHHWATLALLLCFTSLRFMHEFVSDTHPSIHSICLASWWLQWESGSRNSQAPGQRSQQYQAMCLFIHVGPESVTIGGSC